MTVRTTGGLELSGDQRLVALLRWLRDEDSLGYVFVDPVKRRELSNAMTVSWGDFPLQEATVAAWHEHRASGLRPLPDRHDCDDHDSPLAAEESVE